MIKQRFYIERYDWKVVVLYETNKYDYYDIIAILKEICDDKIIFNRVSNNILSNHKNTGFTYSNLDINCSLIIISETTSKDEFIDTLVHEIDHLQAHIATVYNIDMKSEEAAYLIGGIAKTMFYVFRKIISK